MKKFCLNSILAILFSIAILFSVVVLVLFNENFILKEFAKNNYYDEVIKSINEELDNKYKHFACTLDEEKLESDIKSYVKEHFSNKKLKNGITCKVDNDDIKKMYQEYITFEIFENINTKVWYYLFCLVTILIIFIVGSIFIKTQKKHDLYLIFIISFFILLGVYGISYLFLEIEEDIINTIFVNANYYVLAISILLLEVGLIKKIKINLP